jgi:hypothetical protein
LNYYIFGNIFNFRINPKETTKTACASIEQIVGSEAMRKGKNGFFQFYLIFLFRNKKTSFHTLLA